MQSQRLQLIYRDVTRLHRVGFYLKQKMNQLERPRQEQSRLLAGLHGIEEKLALGEKTMQQLSTALDDLNRKLLGGLLLADSHKRKRGRAFQVWKRALYVWVVVAAAAAVVLSWFGFLARWCILRDLLLVGAGG